MFYYKITGKLKDEELASKINDRREGYEDRNKFYMMGYELFEKSERKSYFFIADISRTSIIIGLICKENKRVDNEMHKYIRNLSF